VPVQERVAIARHCGIPDNMAVSDGVHLLVPFATCRAEACAEALRSLELPHLRRLLRRLAPEATEAGDPRSLSTPHERVIARAHGLAPREGLIPFAALQVLQTGRAPGEDGWAWITPAHWRVGQNHVAMAHPQELQLDAEESHTLLEAMQPYFAEDGIALEYDAPLRWLARGDIFRDLPTASLDRVINRQVDGWMPAGDAARPVRRLQQEMQMLLYTLPLNDAREGGGLLPVNSFWVSGTGVLPGTATPGASADLQVTPTLRDAALMGDWKAWAEGWQQLDAREGPRLLQALERGTTVRLTLCGEAGARTWTSQGTGAWRRVSSLFGGAPLTERLEGL
jgi:hypothetical protein